MNVKTNDLLTLAAVNASGIVTAVVMNKKDVSAEFKYQNGDTNIPLSIPGRSIITLVDDSIY